MKSQFPIAINTLLIVDLMKAIITLRLSFIGDFDFAWLKLQKRQFIVPVISILQVLEEGRCRFSSSRGFHEGRQLPF